MAQLTKTVGTNVISTLSVALKVSVERFEVVLALAKGAVNFQPSEQEDREQMAAEWNTHMITVSAGLPANEAVVFGAIVALYLHEGILEQMGVEDGEENEIGLSRDGEMPWSTVDEDGKEYGWVHDSRIDVA
jgi:hypothetical protein